MKHVFLFIVFLFYSCQTSKTLNNSQSNIFLNDSIVEAKYVIKEKIIRQGDKIPTDIFASNDGIDHSEYEEFIQLDSLISVYESYPLTNKEKELLNFFEAKKHLILSQYSKSIEKLKNVKEYSYENYKNLMLGITYDLVDDNINSKKHFRKLLLQFEEMSEDNPFECDMYFLVKILSNSSEINKCGQYLDIYKKMKKQGKIQLVKENILDNVQL